jgi:hypothetical protein
LRATFGGFSFQGTPAPLAALQPCSNLVDAVAHKMVDKTIALRVTVIGGQTCRTTSP